jgi:hypothetical protein
VGCHQEALAAQGAPRPASGERSQRRHVQAMQRCWVRAQATRGAPLPGGHLNVPLHERRPWAPRRLLSGVAVAYVGVSSGAVKLRRLRVALGSRTTRAPSRRRLRRRSCVRRRCALLVQRVGDRVLEAQLSPFADGGVPCVGSEAPAGGREERPVKPRRDLVLLSAVAVGRRGASKPRGMTEVAVDDGDGREPEESFGGPRWRRMATLGRQLNQRGWAPRTATTAARTRSSAGARAARTVASSCHGSAISAPSPANPSRTPRRQNGL